MDTPERAARSVDVLVPVKSFERAKLRLAPALDSTRRAALARAMATRVLAAAAPLPVWCVCDDPTVARWALANGARVEWTPGLGLNGAVQTAIERRRADGAERVVIAHGDLPFAAGLAALADARADEVEIVADRHGTGTNVLSVPTDRGFEVAYGSGSLRAHQDEAARLGLSVQLLGLEHLAWDVDEPADLDVPAHLGVLPTVAP